MRRLAPLAFVALAAPSAAQDRPNLVDRPGFRADAFGYLRAGVGLRGGLEKGQRCFQLPGAPAKYRLGNECEVYVEPGLTLEFGDPAQGATASLNLRASFIASPLNAFDEELSFGEEAWIGLHRLGGTGGAQDMGLSVWAGHRFYKRQDIHINDFYWWDATGLGAGVEGIDLGFADAAVAYFADSAGNITDALEATPYGRLDMRLEGISLGDRTTLDLGLDLRVPDGGGDVDPDNGGGAMLTAHLEHDVRDAGTLTAALQAGVGAGRLLSFSSDPEADDGQTTIRALGSYLWNASDQLSMQAGAIAEWREDDRDWYSIGARPVIRLRGDVYLALEGGIDHVVPETGDARSLAKATAALEWKPEPAFFSRPAIRLYVTGASWDRQAEEAGIAPAFDGQSGVNVGLQIEHFW